MDESFHGIHGARAETTVKELLAFEEYYNKISDANQEQLMNQTQCLSPCSFTEYELARQPLKYAKNVTRFYFSFVSFKAKKRTEILLYPVESLFSELGGALGLLLGFSVLMIWDAVESTVNKLRNQ